MIQRRKMRGQSEIGQTDVAACEKPARFSKLWMVALSLPLLHWLRRRDARLGLMPA